MADPSSGLSLAVSQADAKAAIQSIFSSTKCYDLMAVSSKAVVFEAGIPFQLAFYALIEHGALVVALCLLTVALVPCE
jgi:hypothetical protein